MRQRDLIIENDGRYAINSLDVGGSYESSLIYISGNFDGAKTKLVYLDNDANEIIVYNGLIKPNEQYKINHGSDMVIYLVVYESGVNTRINVRCRGV